MTVQIGAGGMGEVYRARDTRLDREVAIKILPEAFAADTERVARFEREAKTLASRTLRHGNPQTFFERPYVPEDANTGLGRSYALSADGTRFLMLKSEGRLDSEGGAPQVVFVQHWLEEVRRLVPEAR